MLVNDDVHYWSANILSILSEFEGVSVQQFRDVDSLKKWLRTKNFYHIKK